MMYVCERCGSKFSDPDTRTYCKEEYNGVASLFGSRTYGTYDVCPECGSEDVDQTYEDEDIVTYCDVIDDCEECPRYGDDCDGRGDEDESIES